MFRKLYLSRLQVKKEREAYFVGPLRLALSNGPNRVGVSLPHQRR
jgi:hypothetical protein